MKIAFNPHAAAQNPNVRVPQSQTPSNDPTPEGSDDAVEITLSQAARQVLETGDSEYTGKSPAHMARQYIAQGLASAAAEGGDGPDLSGPFGQIVKTFAPGHNKEPETVEEPDVVPEDGGDVAEGTDPTDGTDGTEIPPVEGGEGTGEIAGGGDDTGVVEAPEESGGTEGSGETDDSIVAEGPDEPGTTDGTGGTDPAPVVAEPDITEVLDEGAPADDETVEPGSGSAGSGDAVTSTGDGEPVDDGTAVDSGESVPVIDTKALADELIDQFDEETGATV